jgi:CDP-glucose 4,6-dehydratase
MFGDAFRGRRVFVTGDTGFKGAWLCQWLARLGADVVGVALPPDTSPNLFSILKLSDAVRHHDVDVRSAVAVAMLMDEVKPSFVIHLAAQPLVRRSYREPIETFAINVMGTAHVLEAVRQCPSVEATLIATTDKVYENRGWPWAYRENDALGGRDPYSASKAAAENVVASYRHSFFATGRPVVVARAGNVIGGGDWAEDRLVPDIVRAIVAGKPVELRHPRAVRPWQHVLDALSGYLQLLARASSTSLEANAFNFGPEETEAVDVGMLAKRFCEVMGQGDVVEQPDPSAPSEARHLRLDSTLARFHLGWRPVWSTDDAIARTAAWYRCVLDEGEAPAVALLNRQLDEYATAAASLGVPWARRTK